VSQIWPAIPEFEGIPEVLRGGIWMKAYFLALSRRKTWVLGLISMTVFAGICGALAYRFAGVIGAVVGTLIGSVIGVAFLVRVVLEWQARRLVPEVRATLGWPLVARPNGSIRPNADSVSKE
jgi:hypothetical protein